MTVLLVYPDQIAKRSWFPMDNIWHNSGFNVGHWNEECEAWYINRRRQILNGEVQPRTSTSWRNTLRMTCAVPRVYYQTNLAALDYVQSLFASPILYIEVWNWTLCWQPIFQSLNSSKNVILCSQLGYRQLNVIHRALHLNPSRPDKACRLGYKAKQGYVVYHIRVHCGHTPAHSTWKKHNTLGLHLFYSYVLGYVLPLTSEWMTCVWTWGFW